MHLLKASSSSCRSRNTRTLTHEHTHTPRARQFLGLSRERCAVCKISNAWIVDHDRERSSSSSRLTTSLLGLTINWPASQANGTKRIFFWGEPGSLGRGSTARRTTRRTAHDGLGTRNENLLLALARAWPGARSVRLSKKKIDFKMAIPRERGVVD